MNRSEDILVRADELERWFDANCYAMADPDRLGHLRRLCFALRCCGDAYVSNCAGEIARLGERFFSTRKHVAHANGADGIAYRIKTVCLWNIRNRARILGEQEAGLRPPDPIT